MVVILFNNKYFKSYLRLQFRFTTIQFINF